MWSAVELFWVGGVGVGWEWGQSEHIARVAVGSTCINSFNIIPASFFTQRGAGELLSR